MTLPEQLVLTPDGRVPNSPLPVLVYRGAGPTDARAMLDLFARHGWSNGWRNGIYAYHHFHATTHEVLGLTKGEAIVRLGGEGGPDVTVRAGDVVVLPAGAGHKRLFARDLEVIGAYPDGRPCDVVDADEVTPAIYTRVRAAIAAVPLPSTDPVQGEGGSLLRLWHVNG